MTETKHCRGCAAQLPAPFLDLGRTPLANSYLRPEQTSTREPIFPLAIAYCPRCHLVQLTDIVPPEELFSEYLYFSSYSEIFLAHARAMAESLCSRFSLDRSARVLEVGSNDGYLLQSFLERGIRVLGVEPARNIATVATRRGIPTLNRFFGEAAVEEVVRTFGGADLVVGNNVLAHVPEINGFLRAIAACLKPHGAAVFEFPYLGELLKNTEFDTIYHEHVFYYSLTALKGLAARAGLELFDTERHRVHGGSVRAFMRHRSYQGASAVLEAFLTEERVAGLTCGDRYTSFGKSVEALRRDLVAMLREIRASGVKIAAYGAPAKGSTLLNYCGIGPDLLEFTVDRNPHKQGLLLPGVHLPILPTEALIRKRPDYTLILPWNIVEEIVEQQRAYLDSGGQFIVPVPSPHIIDAHGIVAVL